MPPLSPPGALFQSSSQFSLDSSGVAGFFGGDEAISAMHTVHLYKGRRWLGWFNSPGSYTVAKSFGTIAKSRFWDGLFPGPNDSPAVSFGLDGEKGPRYVAALSGTAMSTGHLAYLTMERSKDLDEVTEIKGRVTRPYDVVYLAMQHVNYDTPVELMPVGDALFGLFPISVSVATCVMCALVYDWFSFSMILFGIISSGIASSVIGRGRLDIEFVDPAPESPPGHGILMGDDTMVVIKGEERDVNAVTKGRFVLNTNPKRDKARNKRGVGNTREGADGRQVDEGEKRAGKRKKEAVEKNSYHEIGICSLLLLVQFLLQLLLIPQGSLFGQIMFLFSLGVSWGYNSYLSSLEKEKIQAKILLKKLGDPKMLVFRAGTRTTMAVFLCLLLFHGVKRSSTEEDRKRRVKILDECLPNDTVVWMQWRERIVEQLMVVDTDGDESLPYLVENKAEGLLKTLLDDARVAFEEYFRIRRGLPVDSSQNR